MRSLVAWSRIFDDDELLCAINTDPDNALAAFVTIDYELRVAGDKLTCLYSTDAADNGHLITVEPKNGTAVSFSVPAAGFVVYR
jgi:hypothetical protein